LFLFLVASNARGLIYVLIYLVVGIPVAMIAVLEQRRFEKQLDEREIMMYRSTYMWGFMTFAGYLFVFCYSVFFLIGGGGQAPVWYFPAMLFSGLLIAQTTQSTILFFWCDKEQPHG
jgi:hypothetical protein